MRATPKLSIALTALLCCALAPGLASSRELPDFTGLVSENGPAVVNISTKQSGSVSQRLRGFSVPDLPEDSPLQDFFRHFFDEEGEIPDDSFQSRSLGSGFFVSQDGFVLTNSHVVESADEIIVRTSDRREFVASLIGIDKRSDIALLKVDGEQLPAAKIGSSKDLQVGEWVLAIGSPFGFESSATAGIVSAKGRSLPSENYVPFIQTDVAINPGNSGGPLFNLKGEVVGVNSQIYSRTGGFMGLSFAIPIDVAMDVVSQLQTKGRVSRGWLGVLIQDVTRELAESFGMDQPKGALVAQVLPKSPAEAADMRPGDVILRYNGSEILTSSSLPPLVGETAVGATASIEVLRNGKRVQLEMTIGELPDEEALASTEGAPKQEAANRLGLVVRDLTPEQRKQLGVEKGGVLIGALDSGPAEQVGLNVGDVILMLDNQPVSSTADFNRILEGVEPGRSVAILIQRGENRMFYAMKLPKE
ncbi:DegQ family serine endoprotease [Thiorhodococcus mannitoliphagus]|uniref:Probable periplasmic serine endoprotease DegP-like n=1 Tax=Thiorhodococcus mannitoliphagus TaxID=329406 RepID=A0A6P1DRD9_9GAMM|nr:DegQ family serine endoprotease [Thiorhodococcus mannitoliphagus]NEX20100.1 DegQ family serine endoprotease [Thiorhodococcus mannitoliphagus]